MHAAGDGARADTTGSDSDGSTASKGESESESSDGGSEGSTETDDSGGSDQMRGKGSRGRSGNAKAGRSPDPARRVQQLRGTARAAQSRSMNDISSDMNSLTSLTNDLGLLPFADMPMVSVPPPVQQHCASPPNHTNSNYFRSPPLIDP